MSEAEKRALWRSWEATRDEDALRRYVWAVCREAPATPLEFRMLKTRKNGRWRGSIEEGHYEAEHDIERLQFAQWSVMPIRRRTVTAPVRRLTVCGPWLPKNHGWREMIRRLTGAVPEQVVADWNRYAFSLSAPLVERERERWNLSFTADAPWIDPPPATIPRAEGP